MIPVENKYDRIIPLLMEIEGFVDSPEYESIKEIAFDLPGVVSAAYSKYIIRVLCIFKDDQKIIPLMKPLNEMAEWRDQAVNNMLEDEVFEMFMDYSNYKNLERFMSAELSSRFALWCKKGNF